MEKKSGNKQAQSDKERREERLKQALKSNLGRRKQQARARKSGSDVEQE